MNPSAYNFRKEFITNLSILFRLQHLQNRLTHSDLFNSQWQRPWSTPLKVMVCCPTAPNHFLNKCWLAVNERFWRQFYAYFNSNIQNINSMLSFEIIAMFARGRWVKITFKQLRVILNVHRQLSHWGRVTHICVNKLTIMGSVNGLSSGRRQAIIWTNAEILLIGPLGTNFSEILIEI